MMQAMGVQNIRLGVPWIDVEIRDDFFFWDTADYLVNAAHDRGMGILAAINSTPRWAGTPVLSGMPDPLVFADYVAGGGRALRGQDLRLRDLE